MCLFWYPYNTSFIIRTTQSYIQQPENGKIQFRPIFTFQWQFHTQVIRQPYLTDRLIVKLREKENTLQCVYLNDFNMAVGAFVLQCNEAKNWYDGMNKARHIYIKLKQDSDNHQMSRHHSFVNNNNNTSDNLSIRKSPLGSSIGEFSVPCQLVNFFLLTRSNYQCMNTHRLG